MGSYLRIAKIVKARKKQGRLVVQSVDGLPFLFKEGMTVHIVPPSLDTPRTVTVAFADGGANDAVVSFAEVADYADLMDYVGRYCLVAKADIDESAWPASPRSLVGRHVEDALRGDLGSVVDVIENPYQSILIIEGDKGEVLLPLVDAFVTVPADDEAPIAVEVPQGLVDGEDCEAIAPDDDAGVEEAR